MIPFLDLKAAYRELKPQVDEAVQRVLESGWYLLGEELKAFEQEFAAYTESRLTVGLGNGLEALVLALKAVGIVPGDEVIVPANRYLEGLVGCSIKLPQVREGVTPAWHLFVIDHPERDKLQAYLLEHGVQTLIHYPIPPHQSQAYAELQFTEEAFPITAEAAKTHLSLPIGPHLAAGDAERVIALCRQFAEGSGQ